MIDGVTIDILRHTLKILISEMYSKTTDLDTDHYSLDDLVNQVIFELIKEEYKKYAPRHTIQQYLSIYDVDADNRKYTRSIQYGQHYRDIDNAQIEEQYQFRISELEPQNMGGQSVFTGHQYTEQEFLGYKMQAECRLLNKLHGHQIDNSKNVSESDFQTLFDEYSKCIDALEPAVNEIEHIVGKTYAYYGIETHFLTEFLYRLTIAAERQRFPNIIPVDRILSVCSITEIIPANSWCPVVYFADNCMLLRWNSFCDDIFSDTDEQWLQKESYLIDCKRIKNIILQRSLDKWVEFVHRCPLQEKSDFVIEHYWIWDNRPEFEWTPERIRYYRKLHKAVCRDFPKPHVK